VEFHPVGGDGDVKDLAGLVEVAGFLRLLSSAVDLTASERAEGFQRVLFLWAILLGAIVWVLAVLFFWSLLYSHSEGWR
jgi:type VI protein secretion system component VasF